jgi:hypothetical protein
LLAGFGHVRGIPFGSVLSDGEDALFAVGAKNEGEDLRNRVVEFPAGVWRFEAAIGTRTKLLIDVAGANVAPVFSLNLFATGAFSRQVFPARAAIQSAVGNQLRIVFDFGIHFISI